MRNLTLCMLFFFVCSDVTSQQPQKRIALVIGSQNYTVLPKLRNSLSDAKAISTTLQAKGFQVKSIYDPKTREEIKDGINWYFNQMRDQNGAVGIIFYAGHGMQYQGENYIIPITASLRDPSDLEDYCVKMNTIMAILNSATSSLNILLLDACRSLPSFTRGVEQGLTKIDAPQGSIIVFATQPGKVASDGTGTHGLFTSKFLTAVNEPNLNISEVFQLVKREVYAESKKDQLPSIEDNAIGDAFYFTPSQTGVSIVTTPQPVKFDYGYGPSDAATVKIGSQEWISKNLNVEHFANGDPIPRAGTIEEWVNASNNHTPAWCYFDNDRSFGKTDGKLYNWYAVSDPRGLAPNDWHIPSDREWLSMINILGGETTAGISLKNNSGWDSNGNGNNKSGFTGIPSGYRMPNGGFMELGKIAVWWSSSEYSIDSAWSRYVKFDEGGKVVKREFGNYKTCGFSVRCIKD